MESIIRLIGKITTSDCQLSQTVFSGKEQLLVYPNLEKYSIIVSIRTNGWFPGIHTHALLLNSRKAFHHSRNLNV